MNREPVRGALWHGRVPRRIRRCGARFRRTGRWGPAKTNRGEERRAQVDVDLDARLRRIPDFPRPGILFIDITTLLKDPAAYREAVERVAAPLRDLGVERIVGPEARGFLLGAPVALALNVGFAPVRKCGKLPAARVCRRYALEYGSDGLELHRDAVEPGMRVGVVDDVLASGGTARAAAELVEELGGVVVLLSFLVELGALRGREALGGRPAASVLVL